MNRSVRVLLVGRHFWPHGSYDSAGFLMDLASGLRRRGADIEVLTPRYASSWPEKFWLREIPVHRPAAAPRTEWSTGRYVRHLTAWLREHGCDYDVVWTDSLREEVTAVIEAAGVGGYATVLRHSGHGPNSDTAWWQSSRAAGRVASLTRRADRVIAPTASSHRGLLTRDVAAEKVVRIDNGFAAASPGGGALKGGARQALAAINGDLGTSAGSPVLLWVGRMTPHSGVHRLVEAAYALVSRYPDLRLWLIGDGPSRESIFARLRSDGLRASFAMPGSFADLTEVMASADLYLQADAEGLDFFLPSAVSAELPLVVVDTEATRAVLGGDGAEHVEWFTADSVKALRVAIDQVMNDLPGRRVAASALRRRSVRARPRSATIEEHLRLFHQLVPRRAVTNGGSSIEAAS